MKKPLELNADQAEELINSIKKSNMTEAHKNIVIGIINTVIWLYKVVKEKNINIRRLQRFFGIKSEKSDKVLNTDKSKKKPPDKQNTEKKKRKGHGKNGADNYTFAEKRFYPHESLLCGDRCPECQRGTLFNLDPGRVLRIVGGPPLTAVLHQPEKLRCSACQEVFTAELPAEVGENRSDETANAMVSILKYGSGFPFYRLEKLQQMLGVPLPASTQWDMVERVVNAVDPIYRELLNIAAQAGTIYIDDTGAKVLSLMNDQEKEKGERTGMFTTGVIAKKGNHEIALFFTGRNHAGENLDNLLSARAIDLPPPVRMADALSRNDPKGSEVIKAKCLIHARRNFVNCYSAFPEEGEFVIRQVAEIYKNEKICKEGKLSPEARLTFHQKHSAPVMDKIKEYTEEKLDKKEVEPNSSLGQALKYLLNHWKELTCFLRVPDCPIDNNVVERLIKKAILHRKNSLFFKNEFGALVGDMLMSIIYTTVKSGKNPFDYLTALQKHFHHVFHNPGDWLPWNYEDTLASLE